MGRMLATTVYIEADQKKGLYRLAKAKGSHFSEEIRAAIDLKTSRDRRFRSGPDTDSLIGTLVRRDGCHFNGNGLETAARMWAAVVRSQAQWKFMRTQGVSGDEHRS